MKSDEKFALRLPSKLKTALYEEAKRRDETAATITILALWKYLDHPNNETEGKKK